MKKLILVSMLAISISACGDRIKPDGESGDGDADSTADGRNTAENSESGAKADGINSGTGIGGVALESGKLVSYEKGAINDPDNVLSDKVIYFAYDSNSVADDDLELVKHHGKYLSFNTNASIRLEGHADERGTREYNIALAEQRAQSVKQTMLYEGAASSQITVISFGEEKPAAFGHDDESMGLNRRVEIVYQ